MQYIDWITNPDRPPLMEGVEPPKALHGPGLGAVTPHGIMLFCPRIDSTYAKKIMKKAQNVKAGRKRRNLTIPKRGRAAAAKALAIQRIGEYEDIVSVA